MQNNLPSYNDRIKSASFAFATVLTSPLYALPTEAVAKASTAFVGKMKQAAVRMQGIKEIIMKAVA